MKPKARIVKTTWPDGTIRYTIQQPHWLFRWWWVSAWVNSWDGAMCESSFSTLEQAQSRLWRFDGSKPTTEVLQ